MIIKEQRTMDTSLVSVAVANTMSKEMKKKLSRERQIRAATTFSSHPLLYQFLCAAARSSGRIFRRMYNNFPFVYKRITADSQKHYDEFKLFMSDDILRNTADMIFNQWEANVSFHGDLSKSAFDLLDEAPRFLKLIRQQNGDSEDGGAPYIFTREEVDGEA